MSRRSFNKVVLIVTMLLSTVSISLAATTSAFAVSCSGAGCNGKNPATTGCNQNAYLAARYPYYDNYGLIMNPFSSSTPYMNVYYSRTCATNWVQVTSNPFGGNTYKEIQALNPNGSGGFFTSASDWGYGSSYTMMVYAPGSTPVRVWSKLTNTSNITQVRADVSTLR